jgi:hypothetical protein
MRISDDHYNRERLRLDFALRFLRHEARTQTIRTWTGLTDDRIQNLYRSYMSRGAHFVPRDRGKSPHQVAYFTRSLRVQWETAQLASLLSLFTVGPAQPSFKFAASLPTVARGEKLCYAFEMYQMTIPASQRRPAVASSGAAGYRMVSYSSRSACVLAGRDRSLDEGCDCQTTAHTGDILPHTPTPLRERHRPGLP